MSSVLKRKSVFSLAKRENPMPEISRSIPSKLFVFCSVALLLIMLSGFRPPLQDTPVQFLDSLDKGLVALTLEGVEEGEGLELTITSRVDTMVPLKFEQGDLAFELPQDMTLTAIVSADRNIELNPGEEVSLEFAQTGPLRMTSGGVLIEKENGGLVYSFQQASFKRSPN